MKTGKERKRRTMTDRELKEIRGGASTPPLSPDQTSDARAVVIEDGKS